VTKKLGWLLNMNETLVTDHQTGQEMTAIDLYFLEESGNTFKATFTSFPYLYLKCKDHLRTDMAAWLKKRFPSIKEIALVSMIDLSLANHLSGKRGKYLKLYFYNKEDLEYIGRGNLAKMVKRNEDQAGITSYKETFQLGEKNVNMEREILDIREYDIDFTTRMAIDFDIRVGQWFEVCPQEGGVCSLLSREDIIRPAEPKVFAFDIETCKSPLKFPKAERDQIMMISYMIDGDGFLITNREIVSEDIDDFEYTPKPDYEGKFIIFNEDNEKELLLRFFEHIQDVRPHIYVTYNGDFFDWPFIRDRSEILGLDMEAQIGVFDKRDIFGARFAVHMDCFNWVQRDSYLPQGSQGLKAVTRYKLGYNPVELDPEDMMPFARDRPQVLAAYSVSDAVATYYLFKKYVHSFIFSLCSIIPMNSGNVLRKGSGTLCETLLMVEAFKKGIICPNRQVSDALKYYNGKLLDSETYIGGHVESFESGVFREDIPIKFVLEPEAYQYLIDDVDATLKFFIEVESKCKIEDVTNYDEVKAKIIEKFKAIQANPRCEVKPLIYHLDVAAMYPNIILTNRLQPVAVVNQRICAACDFNREGNNCQRSLSWRWRGKYYPPDKGEQNQIRAQLEHLTLKPSEVPNIRPWQKEDSEGRLLETLMYSDLYEEQKNQLLKKRVKEYGMKVYKKQTVTVEADKQDIICQRENGFYVDTVRNFRDRRYKFKGLTRSWKGKLKEAVGEIAKKEARTMVTLYDSLQLAHKCILNSFYGYVMRKGARWYSMPMAAITTHIGGTIIRQACDLCEKIGRPLELDTDGIWTCLPGTFPEEYDLKLKEGVNKKGKITIEYPGSMLNIQCHRKFTNTHFQELVDPEKKLYARKDECSIFFEVDGPYLAMILPASTDEGRRLKKRYAVFERDGSLAELKGFEIKRRGELQIIKLFQEEIFKTFLKGHNLQTVYDAVGAVGKRYLDILDTRARDLQDDQLFDLITENKNMSKPLEEYGSSRSTSITCAKRIAEFLGQEMLTGGGLQCKFIISKKPIGDSVSDRAIPVAIFSTERAIKSQFLRKWLKDSSLSTDEMQIRNLLDWEYYRKRFGSNIQKIITIPAAMQKISNPIPQLVHPKWLLKRIAAINDPYQQRAITTFFKKTDKVTVFLEDERNIAKADNVTGKWRNQNASKANEQTQSIDPTESLTSTLADDSDSDNMDMDIPDVAFPNDMAEANEWASKLTAGFKKLMAIRRKRKADAVVALPSRMGRKPSKKFKKGKETVQSFVNKRLHALYTNDWHIIQITPEGSPGNFRVWAIVGKELRHINVGVMRRFYINTDEGKSTVLLQNGGNKVSRMLPRRRVSGDIVEFKMSEANYQLRQKQLSVFMTQSHVEGVYELQVPHAFRACADIGCVATVPMRHWRKKAHTTKGFELGELKFVAHNKTPYLPDSLFDMLGVSFFYHSKASNGRSVMVFTFKSECDPSMDDESPEVYWDAHILVVDPFGSQADLPVNVTEHAATYMQQLAEEEGIEPASPPNISTTIKKVKTLQQGYSDMRGIMEDFHASAFGPQIVLSYTFLPLEELHRVLAPLHEDFPVIEFPWDSWDNEYPALQWQSFAIKAFVERFVDAPEHLALRRKFATFIHAPIGNIPANPSIFGMDLFFARSLADKRHLWWVSEGARPDLGGAEEDDNLFEEEHSNPEVVCPGMYHTICVELSMDMLPVNAVLKADEVTGFQVETVSENLKRGKYVFDDSGACLDAFRILKKLIQNCVIEAGKSGEDGVAMKLLQTFYRWLHSSESYLYDPLLHNYVHKIMKKIFVQLLTQLRELSAKIVYASFHKIIIDTGKTNLNDASTFVNNSVETLSGENSIFQHIDFEAGAWWGCLVFLDKANFSGFKMVRKDPEICQAEEPSTSELTEQLTVDMNICEYLPVKIQNTFKALVGEFVEAFYVRFKEMVAEQAANMDRPTQQVKTSSLLQDFEAWRREQMETYFANKLYTAVTAINSQLPPDCRFKDTQSSDFPVLAGSHLPLNHPALEFIKYITRIYCLDEALVHDVQRIESNAFRLIGVKEFDSNTTFRNPCTTVIIPDVVCTNCHIARDVDVCREQSNPFECPNCRSPRPSDAVEIPLVEMVIRRNTAYQVQDMKCRRCNTVKAATMSTICHCSGSWKTRLAGREFLAEIKKFHTIASFHNFDWLKEVTGLILVAEGIGVTEVVPDLELVG